MRDYLMVLLHSHVSTMNDEVLEAIVLSLTVERAKMEILADVADGTVPVTVKAFSELHDYVDANGYGGAFDIPFLNESVDFWNKVQDAVHEWIKSGGLKQVPNVR